MTSDILEKFALPSYVKGKSFAEASRMIEKKFKDREDNISMQTKKELLERLAQAQEFSKEDAVPSVEMEGGGLTSLNSALGAGTTALSFLQNATDGKSEGAMGAAAGALQGAQAGMAFGPWGAGIGAAIGAGSSLIGKSASDIRTEENKTAAQAARGYSDFRHGGPTDPEPYNIRENLPLDPEKIIGPMHGPNMDPLALLYAPAGMDNSIPKPAPVQKKRYTNPTPTVTGAENVLGKMPVKPLGQTTGQFTLQSPGRQISGDNLTEGEKLVRRADRNAAIKDTLGKVGDKAGEALRYAPVLTDLLQLKNLEKPEYETLSRLDNRYKKDLADEQGLRNVVQQEADNTRRAVLEASGGSGAAARAGLLGVQANTSKALTSALLQADQINRGENRAEQQFNIGVDQTNLQQERVEQELNARNRGVYDSNKSALISSLGNNIGMIGREERIKKMVEEMGICYDSRGRYICGTEERVPENMAYGGKTKYAKGGPTDDLFMSYLDVILKK